MIGTFRLTYRSNATHQSHAPAGHDALFYCRAGRMQSVFDTGLLLFHFDFSRSTNLDYRDTAGQFSYAFLHLFLVVVGGGFFDLYTDLIDSRFDVAGRTRAVDDGGVLLAHLHAFSGPKFFKRSAFEAHADFFGDHLTTSQNGEILQHGFTAVTETRGLHRTDFNDTADIIDHQGRQCFPFDVLSDHEQGAPCFSGGFQHRQHLADVRNLLVVDQNQRVIHFSLHGILIVDEVG